MSRTKKRMKAYVLRPFKKQGIPHRRGMREASHVLGQDWFGRAKSGRCQKNSVEEVRRLKLKHRDVREHEQASPRRAR